jgi:hypothetical protein
MVREASAEAVEQSLGIAKLAHRCVAPASEEAAPDAGSTVCATQRSAPASAAVQLRRRWPPRTGEEAATLPLHGPSAITQAAVQDMSPELRLISSERIIARAPYGPVGRRSLSMRMRQWASEFSVDPPC